MTVDVVGLRALAEKARPGPWRVYESMQADTFVLVGEKGLLADDVIAGPTYEQRNAQYIAAVSPDVVLALLDEITTLRAEVADRYERIKAALEEAWDQGNATGLDGWVGPGRGTEPIDREAVFARSRDIEKTIAHLSVPAVPVPRDNPKHGMIPGTHEQPGGPECRCGMPWDYWNERCLAMTAPVEPQDNPEATREQIGGE